MNREKFIVGIDEAGRGALAGCVYAAAVILSPNQNINYKKLQDSKRLTANKRQELAIMIKETAQYYAVARSSVVEIEKLNILQASLLAMKRAILQLNLPLENLMCLIDGNQAPKKIPYYKTIIKGDETVQCISAASILAKVARDDYITNELDVLHPQYNFVKHKAYATKEHLYKLQQFGICPLHRKTFKPIKNML